MPRTALLLAATSFLLGLLAGCGADSTRRISCEAGESELCFCDDGREGVQLCDDGLLGPCLCGGEGVDDVDIDVPDPGDAGEDAGDDTGEDAEPDTPPGDAGCDAPILLFTDQDGDGHGDVNAEPIRSCEYLFGYAPTATDCNDEDASIFPTAPELCDGIDNDCNGVVDDAVEEIVQWPDLDDDGFGDPDGETVRDCNAIEGYAPNADDCDDERDDVYPRAEDLCDAVDSDCDGEVDEDAEFSAFFADEDEDGYGDADGLPLAFCEAPEGFVDNRRDCDDTRDDVSPDGTEVCNFVDDDCNGVVDDGVDLFLLWPDEDDDTYGDVFGAPIYSCEPVEGFVENDDDCDDTLFTVNPLGLERCNDRDDDCNGLVDDGADGMATFYPDADGDGWGVASGPVLACAAPPRYTDRAGDCDDRVATTNPDGTETCDGVDNDCDTAIDEGVANRCGGCGAEPAEVCGNFVDDDCDGAIDEAADGCFCDGRTNQPCYTGAPDTLGVGICRGGTISCTCPSGDRFCDDGTWGACVGEVLPGTEVCDGIDNNCDGRIDEGLRNACGECGETPVEICDGIDNDCDGSVDEFVLLPCGVCAGDEGVEECGNGLDDDCDGLVDEDCTCRGSEEACYPGPPSTRGVGACTDGVRDCYATAESPTACEGAVLPALEICNDVDDDCDGVVDESSTGCSVCGAAEEICNDVDDDCDGYTDEGLRNGCGDCIVAVVPEETRGLEFCNDIDEDCDGFVDEGLLNACGNCDEACYTDGWDDDDEFEGGGTGDGISPEDGLRLDTSSFTFADLWVANAADDTVTRINTNTGEVIGTYEVGVLAGRNNDNPSRTAVDLDGNAWVANRAHVNGVRQGSVTKVAGGDCVTDCVLFNVNIGGTSIPRGLAVDADNNIWVGAFSEQRLYYLNGEDGAILATYDIGIPIYGLAIDREGIIWIATIDSGAGIGAFDTNTNTFLGNWGVSEGARPYGIAVDASGNVWFGTWTHGRLGRLDRAAFDSGTVTITFHGSGLSGTRGVAVDATGTIWLASSGNNRIARFDGSGTMLGSSESCSTPIGVGVASDGDIWSMCNGSDTAQRWSPTGVNTQNVPVGDAPYSYSDMTGFQLRAFTAPSGTWTQTYDCGFEACGFEAVRWTAIVPAGTTLTVRARSRTSGGGWSSWTSPYASSPADTSDAVPQGRFLEVQVSMTTTEDELTPVLTSLDVDWQRP